MEEEENAVYGDVLEDLMNYGMLGNPRPSYSSDSGANKKKTNGACDKIHMEESIRNSDCSMFVSTLGYDDEIDPDYETFLKTYKESSSFYLDSMSHEEREELDPDYEAFLETYKESSSVNLDSMSHEEQEEGSFENVESNRNVNSGSKRVKAMGPENLSGFSRKEKSKLKNVEEMSKSLKARVPKKVGLSSSKAKTVRSKTAKKVSLIGETGRNGKETDIPSKKRKSAVDENEVKEEVEDDRDVIDESYAELVNYLPRRGRKMVYSCKSDHGSIHQKDDETSDDVEILALDNLPFHEEGYTPFVPSKGYQPVPGEDNWEGIKDSSQSQFREKLMNLLKMPYEEKELQNLWREVTWKKPVQGVKELRGGRMKTYPTKTDGKSYIEWYEDLRMKIDEVSRDPCKTLYLLRGFFFWLKKTAHRGVFKPWLDPLCLSALK